MKKESDALLKKAGLKRAILTGPGISRKNRNGKGWVYFAPTGRIIRDPKRIEEINRLALPPAWSDVWINPARNGHIVATGLDGKGRLQYRYHPDWTAAGAEAKYGGVAEFAGHLPDLRAAYQSDVKMRGMPKRKVVAAVVWLMDLKGMRIGNDEYARKNRHYGLTTIQDGHIRFTGDRKAILEFRAKSGKDRRIVVDEERALVRLLRKCREVGGIHPEIGDKGQDLFRYVDATGADQDIKSHHINQYIYDVCGAHFTAKDFRTWIATWKMADRLATLIRLKDDRKRLREWISRMNPANPGGLLKFHGKAIDTTAARNRAAVAVIDTVAADLGNTRSVCRGSYIHPGIVDDFLEGRFESRWARAFRSGKRKNLEPGESATLRYLRSR